MCAAHQVDPLVLFNILDHFQRRNEGQDRVIGTLLGVVGASPAPRAARTARTARHDGTPQGRISGADREAWRGRVFARVAGSVPRLCCCRESRGRAGGRQATETGAAWH